MCFASLTWYSKMYSFTVFGAPKWILHLPKVVNSKVHHIYRLMRLKQSYHIEDRTLVGLCNSRAFDRHNWGCSLILFVVWLLFSRIMLPAPPFHKNWSTGHSLEPVMTNINVKFACCKIQPVKEWVAKEYATPLPGSFLSSPTNCGFFCFRDCGMIVIQPFGLSFYNLILIWQMM